MGFLFDRCTTIACLSKRAPFCHSFSPRLSGSSSPTLSSLSLSNNAFPTQKHLYIFLSLLFFVLLLQQLPLFICPFPNVFLVMCWFFQFAETSVYLFCLILSPLSQPVSLSSYVIELQTLFSRSALLQSPFPTMQLPSPPVTFPII